MDIVKRLRQEIAGYTDGPIEAAEATMHEAANEIELLRKQLAHSIDLGNSWLDEIERLREALKTFADNVRETNAEIDKNWAKTIYPLKAENQRLREALKEILAHETDYEPYDCIEIARAALKEDE